MQIDRVFRKQLLLTSVKVRTGGRKRLRGAAQRGPQGWGSKRGFLFSNEMNPSAPLRGRTLQTTFTRTQMHGRSRQRKSAKGLPADGGVAEAATVL